LILGREVAHYYDPVDVGGISATQHKEENVFSTSLASHALGAFTTGRVLVLVAIVGAIALLATLGLTGSHLPTAVFYDL
jgi:hypothetical protein